MGRNHKTGRVPFLSPEDAEDRTCPACDRPFDSAQGKNAHLSTATSCRWYRKGKNRQPNLYDASDDDLGPTVSDAGSSDREVDVGDLHDVLEHRDLFQFVLPPSTSSLPAHQGEASGSAGHSLPIPQVPALDDDDDSRVEEEDMEAGVVIRMEETVMETWRAYFGENGEDEAEVNEDRMDIDGDDGPQGRPQNNPDLDQRWKPFASELDWRVAMWVIREDVGQNSLNRFLKIPGVVEKLGLTFKDVRELFIKVDDIPDRAAWKMSNLTFPDRRDEEHIVRYRDIIEAIKALLGNPSYAKYIVYRPRRVFSDRSKTKCIFTEMWTGFWCNAVQVSPRSSFQQNI
ncbi:uncharacterized protein B0H18DRAFT_884869 [Fomitopsis serialis]|uniref:uncharacterized protein n=1 Tax=Fomitopsis serialis TaxID=139415 RepID=UPI002007AC64|nr:uncharacterized protein B0H18DRAFT_884869 [Neoantrodia serialis]KAH9916350.1 hypothetical protein B0H18DRAFT_884869 [Neoantrodia serialis]